MKANLAFSLAVAAVLFAAPAGAATDVTWTGTPLTASSTSIRTDGTLKYAYARGDYTANDVTFTGVGNGIVNTGNCVVWEATGGANTSTPTTPSDTETGGYANLLGHCWWANEKDRKIALYNLESGKQYLVQIIAFNSQFTTQTATSPDSAATVKFAGTGWEYGSSLTGTFTASGTSEVFTIGYSGQCCINGIQVRELDGSGGGDEPTVVEPSIGSASVSVAGSTATVSLGGIVLGTDAQGTAATSYAVSYSLTNAAPVTALSNQSGATASFGIANLADGSYTCEVTITTDKNKTASKSVGFTIGMSGQGGGEDPIVPVADGWTAVSMGSTSASIRTDGTLKYAYARENYTVNGVAFVSEGTDGIDNADCTVDITHDAGSTPPDDTEEGDYKNLLGKGWYASEGNRAFTLRNLEAGKRYLVQIIAFRSNFTTQSATAPDGASTIKFGGSGWEYGGSLIGIFMANETSKTFTVSCLGNAWLNAIQVRELSVGPSLKPAVITVK